MKTSKNDIEVLAAAMKNHNLSALEYKDSEFSLRLEKGGAQTPLSNYQNENPEPIFKQAKTAESEKTQETSTEITNEDYYKLTSPIVGNFYTSKKPGESPFISVGDEIKAGDVIAIIEAMKVMNEIKSPVSGQVKAINYNDGEFVDTVSELMLIEER